MAGQACKLDNGQMQSLLPCVERSLLPYIQIKSIMSIACIGYMVNSNNNFVLFIFIWNYSYCYPSNWNKTFSFPYFFFILIAKKSVFEQRLPPTAVVGTLFMQSKLYLEIEARFLETVLHGRCNEGYSSFRGFFSKVLCPFRTKNLFMSKFFADFI